MAQHVLACAAQDLKPVMINGRMSQSSFKRWQKFPRIARLLLGKFAVLTAQDEVIARGCGNWALKMWSRSAI